MVILIAIRQRGHRERRSRHFGYRGPGTTLNRTPCIIMHKAPNVSAETACAERKSDTVEFSPTAENYTCEATPGGQRLLFRGAPGCEFTVAGRHP